MTFLSVRVLSTGWYWQRVTSLASIFRLQRLNASSQGCQSTEEAFWDSEGSVAVSSKQTGDLTYLSVKEKKEPAPKVEESDLVRITKFGHIRLDVDNPAVEIISPTTDSESLNFIDNQFFGDKLSSYISSPVQNQESHIQASDVPIDTNTVDQQYFYPNTAEEKLNPKVIPAPSASELEFKENEVDSQYFGKKMAADTSPVNSLKTPVGKVSAYNYLKSIQAKAVHATNNSADELMGSNETSPNKIYADMVPNLYKMPNDLIVSLLKKSIIYKKGTFLFWIISSRISTICLSVDGILAIDKPYGLVTTDADKRAPIILTNLLPALSEVLRFEKLYTVHRLDRDTTGSCFLILQFSSNLDPNGNFFRCPALSFESRYC